MCDLVTDTLASVVLGYFACAIWIFSCQSCCLKANGFTLPGGSSLLGLEMVFKVRFNLLL